MFRITEDPSSGSLVQCLAKNYKKGSIVSVNRGKVGVMAAYCSPMCVSSSLSRKAFLDSELHTHTHTHTHIHRVTICCHKTDHVHVNGHDRIIL